MFWIELLLVAALIMMSFTLVWGWARSVIEMSKAQICRDEAVLKQLAQYESMCRDLLAAVIAGKSEHPGISAGVARELVRRSEQQKEQVILDEKLGSEEEIGGVTLNGRL